MTRVKRSVHARKKRRATLDRTKGFRGEAHSSYKRAKEALMKAESYAYRDRRNRKRDFRRLWIARINAAARQEGMTYSHLHARPQAGRHRGRPQDAGRHRRARCRDLPTLCRERPRGVVGLTAEDTRAPGAPPTGRAPFFVRPVITSPHNDTLTQVRKLAGRKWRDKLGEFVAEGEDLIDGRRGRGLAGVAAARGRRLRASTGEEVAPPLLAKVSQLGSGTRALAVYPQRWAPAPAGPLCVALWGVGDPGNVGTVLRSALAFGAGSVALGPGTRRSVRAQGRAGLDGRDLLGARSRACAGSTSCPAGGWRWPPREGRPLAELEDRRGHARGRRGARGAARCGARRVRRGVPHPDPLGVAERGHGRDGGNVRGVAMIDRIQQIQDAAAQAVDARRLLGGARARPHRVPRAQGRAAAAAARRRRAAAGGARQASARRPTRRARGVEALIDGAQGRARPRRARRAARRRRRRRHAARLARPAGRAPAPADPDAARARGHLRRARLPRRRGPGGRDRRLQLRRPQPRHHAPGAAVVGHVLRRRRHRAAHAHLADAGALDDEPSRRRSTS